MASVASETMVRMGELAVSKDPGHVLASIGLGSCIGLVLLEATRPIAGLAHIMLPSAGAEHDAPAGKFADKAVSALLKQLESIGAARTRLEAILVGGASMFSFATSSSLEIGKRNEEATREQLKGLGIKVAAAATGGTKGRTVRVQVSSGVITVKEPGAPEVQIFAPAGRSR
jgi:chemotaxis protein CheD